VGAWLSQRPDVEIDARDFFLDRFTEEEFRTLIGDQDPAEFFSWASPTFRKLEVERDSLDASELVRMMMQEPRLIRRPLIEVDGRLLAPQSGTDRIITSLVEALGTE
jgi:arsenate reductase-like glutaredoxin family protein